MEELGKVAESQVAAVDEKELNPSKTEETTNGAVKESVEVNKAISGEEHQKDSMTEVDDKTNKVDKQLAATNIDNDKEEPNKEKTTVNDEAETDTNSKNDSLNDERADEPDTEKSKVEGEKDHDNTKSSSALPFPSKFYEELETYDCDPGPLWQFDDPHFIELVQTGNPPKDVAYVRLKKDAGV